MELNVNDPALRGLWGLDEAGATADRTNSAKANLLSNPSLYELEAAASSSVDGFPLLNDDRGGKAVGMMNNPGAPFTNQARWLQSKSDRTAAQMIADGIISNPDDWATVGDGMVLAGRFNWLDFATGSGGGTDIHHLLGVISESETDRLWVVTLQPDTNIGPATGGKLRIWCGAYSDVIDGTWTTSGSPPTEYILDDGWYRWAVKLEYTAANTVRAYCVVFREATGAVYTFAYTGIAITGSLAFDASDLSYTDYRVYIGSPFSSSGLPSHPGYHDENWIYIGVLSDEEIETTVVDGIDIPWNDEIYTVNDHDVRLAVANENSAFPVPRQLPVGGLSPRHVVGVHGQRIRFYYEGFRAGRPWSIRRIDLRHDTLGPFNRGRRGNLNAFNDFTPGLIRQPGQLPPGALVGGYDADLSGPGIRRRRGYRIRRAVDTSSNNGTNSFYSWRNTNDELFWLYKVAGEIFYDSGSGVTSLGTGWNASRHVIAAALDDRLVLIQSSKREIWNGGVSTDEFGEAAPTGGSAAATGVGTLVGTFIYAYTFYDPSTGDETAPTILAGVALSNEDALLSSLDNSPTNDRFTQQRIYRSTADGAAPNLFLIDTQALATTYTDNSEPDGTDQVDSVTDADGSLVNYISGAAPDDFEGCFVHQQRMFYWAGRRLYWSEPNDPLRWDPGAFITVDEPIIGGTSHDYRVVLWTRNNTEIVESDFARDDNGLYSVRQNKTDEHVGIVGPLAHTTRDQEIWWLDRRGIYMLRGDKPMKMSANIDNLFRYMNTGRGENFTAAYNHIRDQIWFAAAFGDIQTDNTRVDTVVTVFPGERPRFNLYRTQCAMVTQFDDDLNGIRLGAMDHLGNFKEYESYEGEGQEGDEAGTWEADAGIASIAGSVVSVNDSPGWTTDEHRGKSVILRDVSTGARHWYLIVSNTSDTFTTSDTPDAALAADDGYYIGGMMGDAEFAEQQFGTPNVKVLRDMQTQFDDLTLGRLV